MEEDEIEVMGGEKLGELIILGYNGVHERRTDPTNLGRRKGHQSRMIIRRRPEANGIQKKHIHRVGKASESALPDDVRTHTVTYAHSRHSTTVVEYAPDPTTDMFQIGRSSEPQIDFTVVDTWLGANGAPPDGSGGPINPKAYSSTISRYACRLLFKRDDSASVKVFAAGFDEKRNIFLGEKATKWQRRNGEVDGLTTNGILILNPKTPQNRASSSLSNEGGLGEDSMYVWREVSVDGDIYSLRVNRSATQRGELVRGESNHLEDGCLIDLCGATVLWRTLSGLANTPTLEQLEAKLDELNAGKPTCPVNLNTLVVPKHRRRSRNTLAAAQNGRDSPARSDRQPYIYTRCGHVLGRHDWGHAGGEGGGESSHVCPMCRVESEKIVALCMGMEAAFHLDSSDLDHAFLPCGHLASASTVQYWSRIPLPHGTSSFHPVCPFCTQTLSPHRPFIRVLLDLQG